MPFNHVHEKFCMLGNRGWITGALHVAHPSWPGTHHWHTPPVFGNCIAYVNAQCTVSATVSSSTECVSMNTCQVAKVLVFLTCSSLAAILPLKGASQRQTCFRADVQAVVVWLLLSLEYDLPCPIFVE